MSDIDKPEQEDVMKDTVSDEIIEDTQSDSVTEDITEPESDTQQGTVSENFAQSADTNETQVEDMADMPLQLMRENNIYALGIVEIVFPNKGIEKQFLQAAMLLGVDEKDYFAVFTNQGSSTDRDKYLYLAEQVQWVLSIKQRHVYLLKPADKPELIALIDSLKPPEDTLEPVYTCVIGYRTASVNSFGITQVVCQQVYHHTLAELHDTIQKISSAETAAIQEVINKLEYEPNLGDSDFTRAKNFVAFRYPDIYQQTHAMQSASKHAEKASLIKIDFSRFDAVSERVIVNMSMTYQENSSTKRHYYFCRVDVTGLYPFINTPIQAFTPLLPFE
ncbi:hypothetical protein EYS14_19520 [Alteromonadaceae bacterium M269]|nr:hypothetical protein EYS14_19520 [Alteromonadaceae bacterium M269]